MLDTEAQLARLKQRIAAIDRSYAARKAAPPAAVPPPERKWSRSFIEEWASGEVVTTEFGPHFQMERLFPSHRTHGCSDIGGLSELPSDLLGALSGGEIGSAAPERWAFLDTETTGLAGGSGTYAFLIGVGRITPEGFRVRQFFMREYAEERSLLHSLNQHLSEFDVLITYNGKSYDQPLLETRFRITRHAPPFGRLSHLDLLYGARRLWKLRLESCRLIQLEEQILGFYREGDLPGELIPYVYFEYLRSREAGRLVPVFHHNAIDILTLACLTAIVPAVFRNSDVESLASVGVRRGEDLAGIARWLSSAGELEPALDLMKRAVQAGMPDPLLFRTLLDIGLLEKKLGRPNAALSVFTEIAACRNAHQVTALEELAKHYEHEERNHAIALEFTKQALSLLPSDALRQRHARLERRLAKPKPRRLL